MAVQKVSLGPKKVFSIHKGALHRALGVPEGSKIPPAKLEKASNSGDEHVKRMAASAKGFKAMHHGSGSGKKVFK